jgi:predicted RNase H-like HicB family nuclease
MQLTAVLTEAEEGGIVAVNPETGTTTQGETISEALSNLREATELYVKEFPLVARSQPAVQWHDFIGTLKDSSFYNDDPAEIQRKMRDEWSLDLLAS